MAKSCFLSLFQLLCLSSAVCQTDSTLCVLNSTDAQSSDKCLTSDCESYTNFSFENLSADSDHEVSIHLCSSVYEIGEQDVVTFRDMVSVSIFGVEGESTLHCQTGTTGLQFINITTVEIENVKLDHCNTIIEDHFQVNFSSSIHISGCINVVITDVTVQNPVGVGLVLIENKYISITNSTFRNNRPGNTSAGGGVFIESSTIENGSFDIENCIFESNSAETDPQFENQFARTKSNDVIDFVRGGGMNVYFRGETHHVNLTIFNCTFNNNSARYGGALQLSFTNSSHDINVLVNQSDFQYNRAQKRGGAVGAGYIHKSSKMNQNLIKFSNCNFSNNRAEQGGGVYLYAAPTNYNNNNTFEFHKCLWNNNKAHYGAAVKINPYTSRKFIIDGLLPKLIFQDCTFIHNNVTYMNQTSKMTYQIRHHGKGVLLTNKINIILRGKIEFKENIGTAIYIVSGAMDVQQGSNITFQSNHGYEGGAIGLQGSSAIHVNDDISIRFLNNSASGKGGAIFQETLDDPGSSTVRKCFIKYVGDYMKKVDERNITLFFRNNTLNTYNSRQLNLTKLHKQSIYLYSVDPCKMIYPEAENYLEALNLIANFTFEDYQNNTDIATIGSKFKVYNIPNKFIPGNKTRIDVTLLDDTNSRVASPVFKVSILTIFNGSVSIDPAHEYLTDNKLRVLGKPRSQAKLRISLNNLQDIELSFNITLQECPPGYIFDKERCECLCSSLTATKYRGIQSCNWTTYQAILVAGYWAGYNVTDDSEITDNSFRTSNCPVGFCTSWKDKNNSEILLSTNASIREVSREVCNENRLGRVCSRCKRNMSVFYHTQNTFDCKREKYCSWGIVLYILSEIVPVTILFLLVILFDIKLASGTLNAFIFYTQIFETLQINANNLIDFTREAGIFLEILNFITSFFNLKFFAHSELSFCLFKGATSLNIIAFNYVTVIYSLLLVLLTVALMNTRLNRLNKYIQKIKGRKTYISQSIIHGLSGFLVICYARSTKVSLQILTPVTLFGKNRSKEEYVFFYYGEFDYFKGYHLPYAIPAIFVLVFMGLLPPLLLLSFPLCYKVFALFRIQESKFTDILCKIIPLEKLKPFFDSFQGTFKDEHRYFAGLYFIYRLLALLLYTLTDSLTKFYFLLEIQFILTLGIHSWTRPYKKKWHNRLDTFLLTLLSILNGITLCNYHLRINQLDYHQYIELYTRIQLFLAYSPLMFIVGYILIKKIFTTWHLKKRSQTIRRSDELEISLSMLDREDYEQSTDVSYQKCK